VKLVFVTTDPARDAPKVCARGSISSTSFIRLTEASAIDAVQAMAECRRREGRAPATTWSGTELRDRHTKDNMAHDLSGGVRRQSGRPISPQLVNETWSSR
jgi:hypothetical protein